MLSLRLPIPRLIGAGEVIHGSGSLSALRMLDGVSVVVIASRSVLKHHRQAIERAVNHLKLDLVEYAGGEPTWKSLAPLAQACDQANPNWIVAVGGGSVIDAAKLAWVLYEQPDAELDLLARPFALRGLRGRSRFVAVPTTAGTGSEVSSAAVVKDPATERKIAVVSHELLPDIAILDPRLTANVPRDVMLSAGLDALAHSLEGYVSKLENPIADVYAEKSVEMILRLLPMTIDDADESESRLQMMIASMMAGIVQNLKVPGVGHAVAHQVGARGIPHGYACGILLDSAILANMSQDKVRLKYSRLARSLGLADCEALVDAVRSLKSALNVPERLSGLASSKELETIDRERIFKGARADICSRANPVEVTDELLAEVLEMAW